MDALSIFYNLIWPLGQEIPNSHTGVFWAALLITLDSKCICPEMNVVSSTDVISKLDFELPGSYKY